MKAAPEREMATLIRGCAPCRDGHGYPCVDSGPSLAGYSAPQDSSDGFSSLFNNIGDDEVELEKSNVLLLGPTGWEVIYSLVVCKENLFSVRNPT